MKNAPEEAPQTPGRAKPVGLVQRVESDYTHMLERTSVVEGKAIEMHDELHARIDRVSAEFGKRIELLEQRVHTLFIYITGEVAGSTPMPGEAPPAGEQAASPSGLEDRMAWVLQEFQGIAGRLHDLLGPDPLARSFAGRFPKDLVLGEAETAAVLQKKRTVRNARRAAARPRKATTPTKGAKKR